MSTPETKQVLITVKAPPNPSKKYQEANCCAGIDLESGKWIRLYPIPFRLLDSDKQFPKYSIISVNCKRPLRDNRVESYKVDQDSIRIIKRLGTQDEWYERKKIILPTLSPSFCQILEDVSLKKSLGVFKPVEVQFEIKKSTQKSAKEHRAAYDQYYLFDKKLRPIEQIPFNGYYTFKCQNSPQCTGHKLMIHDWEFMEAYRSWRNKYTEQNLLLDKIRETWLDKICGPEKDAYFYVGNIWQRPKQFMVLGVFYPPKSAPSLFST